MMMQAFIVAIESQLANFVSLYLRMSSTSSSSGSFFASKVELPCNKPETASLIAAITGMPTLFCDTRNALLPYIGLSDGHSPFILIHFNSIP